MLEQAQKLHRSDLPEDDAEGYTIPTLVHSFTQEFIGTRLVQVDREYV